MDRIFTFLSKAEIETLIQEHKEDQSKRLLQKSLAKELTLFVHGQNEYNEALETTDKLFSRQQASADSLTVEDLENMQGIIRINYPLDKLAAGVDIVSFLAETNIFSSKGEARKMIQNGGVSINRNKVEQISDILKDDSLLHNKYLLIQKGKKHYYLLTIQ